MVSKAARGWISTRGGEFSLPELADAVAALTGLDRKGVYKTSSVLLCDWVKSMKLNKRADATGMLYKRTGLWTNLTEPLTTKNGSVAQSYSEFRASIKAPATQETES